jgi:hypothetical protein
MMDWYEGSVRQPLLPGAQIKLRGQTFTIAALNIKRAIESCHAREVLATVAPESPEGMSALVEMAGIALRGNYPQLTNDLLEEELNVTELAEILRTHAAAEKGRT